MECDAVECVAILALRGGGGYDAINIIPKQFCFQFCKLIKILHILVYFQLRQDSFLFILVAHSGFRSVFWGAGIQGRIPVPAGIRRNPAATSLMFRLFYGPEPYFRSGLESVPV